MPLGQKEKTAAGGLLFLAGIVGLEPAKRESKSRVLPLHHIPIRYYYMPYIGFCQYIMFRRGCQYKDLPGAAEAVFVRTPFGAAGRSDRAADANMQSAVLRAAPQTKQPFRCGDRSGSRFSRGAGRAALFGI